MSKLTERLSTEQLEKTREWCLSREAQKPWYGEFGDSPKLLTKCDFMVALIDEVLAGRLALQEQPLSDTANLIDQLCEIAAEFGVQAINGTDDTAKGIHTKGVEAKRRLLDHLTAAHAERERLRGAVSATLTWAEQRCPCRNDEPNPCPLCGASIDNLEVCKSAENTLPKHVLEALRVAARSHRG